jgi:heme exporter protein A
VADPSKPVPALAAWGLQRAYGDSWVLQGVDIRLEVGGSLAVIGANGAGKSTLLRILASLLRPTDGEVTVLGCALPDEAWRLRGRIGYLGHEALLYRDLTAEENLRFHARLFGLAHRARTRVGEMSAGMVQRLAICRTILHDPELLLLDEPVAHLDPEAAATVAPLIGARPERSRVIVTHDVEAALGDADGVLALGRDGRVAFSGPASEFDPGRAREVYASGVGGG